jgi:hypothetical protein
MKENDTRISGIEDVISITQKAPEVQSLTQRIYKEQEMKYPKKNESLKLKLQEVDAISKSKATSNNT